MLYILDTANLDAIRHYNEFYPLDGVTTNPTIISREKADFWTLVKEIRNIIGKDKMLHVQTTQTTADKIVEEAKLFVKELGKNTFVKIPINEEGLKATTMLKDIGIKVTITAIFTPQQALLAAKAGASFVAPYVNKLDSFAGNGTEVVAETVELFNLHNLDCKVLAASFRNAEQVHRCALAGCHSITMNPDVFKLLINHPLTDAAVTGFEKDWKSVYGDKTILDF